MIKRLFLLLITSFSLSIISGCVDISTTASKISDTGINQNETVTIKGVVEDQSNKPVPDAIILIKEDTKVIAQTKTNAKGEFSVKVPKVFGNSYFVEADKSSPDGPMTKTILVVAGEEANFTGEDRLRKTEVPAKPVPEV